MFALAIPVFALALLLSFPVPLKKRFVITRLWSRFVTEWLRITCNLTHEVRGLDNIPPQPGIVFAKHQSTWETVTLNFWFTPQSWVIKRELMWIPFFGWGAYMMQPIALNRGAGRKAVDQLVEQGRDRLQKGFWIIIFPEGTRVAPGQRGHYRVGGAALAAESQRHAREELEGRRIAGQERLVGVMAGAVAENPADQLAQGSGALQGLGEVVGGARAHHVVDLARLGPQAKLPLADVARHALGRRADQRRTGGPLADHRAQVGVLLPQGDHERPRRRRQRLQR